MTKAAQSVDWKGPTGKQPDLSQYSDLSVEVSLAKQRVYVKSGGQTIYTMIASTGVDDATPHGSYTIDTRGEHFYNAEEGMGATIGCSSTVRTCSTRCRPARLRRLSAGGGCQTRPARLARLRAPDCGRRAMVL